ncbi:MAG: hypothetical protein IJQ45_08980 [Clostridia bacterium]|nr:hypothetical protein [Clostridia bacterium]
MRSIIDQEKVSKIISYAVRILVLVAILAFFLPYASCSVGSTKIDVSLSDIATGADKEVSVSLLGYSESESVPMDPHPAVFLFLLLPILALALSFLKMPIARGIVYLVDGISLLIYNSRVMQAIQSEMSYGSYDFSKYVINKEIGYSLYQLHSWAMLIIGAASIAAWYHFSTKREESSGLSSSSPKCNPFERFNDDTETAASTATEARKESDENPDRFKPTQASTDYGAEADKTKHENDEEVNIASPVSSKLVTSFTSRSRDEVRKEDRSSTEEKASDSSDNSLFSPPTGF